MTSQYYRLLFAGELGYELVAEFSAYPRLGSWVIRDDHADESFSVYDHPHVFVFGNTGRLSKDELALRLGRYLPPGGLATRQPGRAQGARATPASAPKTPAPSAPHARSAGRHAA